MLRLLALTACLAMAQTSDLAEKWKASGQYFEWKSLQIFYTCLGDASKPAILMLHGFPTSSFDSHALAENLQSDYHVCTFDFPGYGLSDKPAGDHKYTLADDADLASYFALNVVQMRDFALFAHDRGDSVALALIEKNPPLHISHLFLTNGNMHLPLANLTDFQKRMLDPATSPNIVKQMSAPILAAGMGNTTFTPPLKPSDPEVAALAYFFAYQSGIQVMPQTIQYLNERKQFENRFLEALAKSPIPTTIIWGVHDMISPVRVADYVWNTALKNRKAPGSYWLMPCANHYLQHDQPDAIATIVRLTRPQSAPYNLSSDSCAPVLVAHEN